MNFYTNFELFGPQIAVKSRNNIKMGIYRYIQLFYTDISKIKEGCMEKCHYLAIVFINCTILVNFYTNFEIWTIKWL